MKKIDKTDTLQKILENRHFSVDYFQREYRWGRKQIEQMLSDFQNTFEEYYDPENHDSTVEVAIIWGALFALRVTTKKSLTANSD